MNLWGAVEFADIWGMANLSVHIFRFIDCLESMIANNADGTTHHIQVQQVSDLVYTFDLPDSNLALIYYLPGANRGPHYLEPDADNQIIHIDEDVWLNKPAVLLNRIKVLLGKGIRIYARQCVVARIDKKTALSFQKEHHLQAELPGKYRYGLFLQGELMAVMVFSGGRNMRHSEDYRSFECLRFCSKQGYVIVGGFTKLLRAFIADFQPNDIMTYVDKDWSDGSKFERMGFVRLLDTPPQYFWVNKETKERISVKTYEKLNTLEQEKFYKISNCGSIKMVKIKMT